MKTDSLHIIHVSAATSWRGGEQQLAYLLKGLSEHDVSQEVLCVRESPLAEHCVHQKIKATLFKKRSAVNMSAAKKLAGLCKIKSNAIIHCHDSHAHTIAYLSAIIFRNRSGIVVHRRVDFPVSGSFLSKAKYNLSTIKRFICVSEAIRNILVPAIKNPKKAIVIHSGIDQDRFTHAENKELLKKEFKLGSNHILIGNISAIAPHKDYFTFIATAAELLKTNTDLRFLIIGDGPDRESIEHEIASKKLQDYIFLAGFRKNIPDLLKELNVLLLTSKTEGLGTTILDAFAAGVPVVATCAGGIPEIVEHKVTGLLAPVGNAAQLAEMVGLMLNDTGLRQNIIREARNKVKDFGYLITAKKTLEVYKQVRND